MIPIFKNQSVGNQICIDWDLYFADFLKLAMDSTRVLIDEVRQITGLKVTAWYQESAKGNVHIGLRFDRDISVLDAFMIRGFIADDTQRLRLDMARYMRTGSLHEMNRCFQNKIEVKGGQATLLNAGPWIRLEETTLPGVTGKEARHLILMLQDEELRKKKRLKAAEEELNV
jgi:hypothetical protein